MKIGIYDPYLDALEGGEKYMLTAASCLSDTNDVVVFWDDKSILEKGSKKYFIDLKKVRVVSNIFSSKISLLSRFQETKKYDAILYLSDGSIPIISTRLYLHFQFPTNWIKKTFMTVLKMSRVSGVICNSKFTKKYIDNTFSVKSHVVNPPVFLTKEENIKTEKENIILSVGRYSRMGNGEQFKKHNRMIETFKKMVDAGLTNWQLILVISYQKRDEDKYDLEELAKRYPIHIRRNISRKEIENIYKKTKIYWHATGLNEDIRNHPELAEHFGISTVEAMHYGAVPVVINAGGQPEIVTDNYNGFLWESESELIEKTNILISNERKLKSLSIEAEKTSSNYTTNIFCKKLHTIIV